MLLSFLLLLLSAPLQVFTARPVISKPDYNLYHTKYGILNSVRDIVGRHPAFMKIEELEEGTDAYSIAIPVVTIEPGGFTDVHPDKLRVLMSFGEHGREIITTEFGLKLLECFESEEQLKTCVGNSEQFTSLQDILNKTILKIIPMENPAGREKVENGDLCERKNGRGVDINRNWDIDFGKKEEDYDASEEYPGEHAFSEPETAILRDLAIEFEPHVWIAVHSGMCAVFMPYDHVGVMPTGESADAQLEILKTLKSEHLSDECAYGPGGKTVGYVAHGTGTDYMYSVLNVPLAFTWEIYGDDTAGYAHCYKMFNPTTEIVIQETLSTWLKVFFKLIQFLPGHPDIPGLSLFQNADRNKLDNTIESTEAIHDSKRLSGDESTEEVVRRAPQTFEPVTLKTSSQQLTGSFRSASVFGWVLLVFGAALFIRLICQKSRKGMAGRQASYREGHAYYGLGYT